MKTEAIDKLVDQWEGVPEGATRADLSFALYKLRQDLQRVPELPVEVINSESHEEKNMNEPKLNYITTRARDFAVHDERFTDEYITAIEQARDEAVKRLRSVIEAWQSLESNLSQEFSGYDEYEADEIAVAGAVGFLDRIQRGNDEHE